MTETAKPKTEEVGPKPEGPREAASRVGREIKEPKSIAELLSLVMHDVGAVRKTERNSHANYNFRGIDAVVNAASPALRARGVVVVPNLVSVRYDDVKTSNNKLQTACRVVVDYTFHGPAGDFITCTVAAEAWDGGDKATPQAMSVAFRIALLQALCLPTDEVEVDSREPYERVETPMMTKDQFGRMKEGFTLREMSGPENSEARSSMFAQVLGRPTNGADLTSDEAEAVNNYLFMGEPTAEQMANLENTLGAKPLDGQSKTEAQLEAEAAEAAGAPTSDAEVDPQAAAEAHDAKLAEGKS